MNICIPVNADLGLSSQVSKHFGSAPIFLIIDTETLHTRAIINHNEHHSHGACQPLKALAGENLNGIVVSGIGMGALKKCQAANIKVFRSTFDTVADTITAFKSGTLQEVAAKDACTHHGGAHSHDHGDHHHE